MGKELYSSEKGGTSRWRIRGVVSPRRWIGESPVPTDLTKGTEDITVLVIKGVVNAESQDYCRVGGPNYSS